MTEPQLAPGGNLVAFPSPPGGRGVRGQEGAIASFFRLGAYAMEPLPAIAQNTPSPSLETDGRNSKAPSKTPQQKKRGRLFQRLKSGMTWHKDERLRFMTLTSSNDSKDIPIGRSWNHFVTRVRQYTPMKLIEEGYITWNDAKTYFRHRPYGKSLTGSLSIDFCKVETEEGNGVLHVACYGDYLPQSMLSDLWNSIHKSPVVDIRSPKGKHSKQLSSYFLRQYVVDQDALVRYSWSKGWVYRGFCREWSNCWKKYGFAAGLGIWYWSMEQQTTWTRWDGKQTKLLPEWEIKRISFVPPQGTEHGYRR